MKRFDLVMLMAAVALVAGGTGFALGHSTAGKTASAAASSGNGGTGNTSFGNGGKGGGGGYRRGGFGTRGTVASVSGNTITITDQNGTSHTVNVSSSTSFTNGADRTAASLSDVTAGSTILASGQTSGTSINATRVIINPPAPGSFGNGGSGGASGGSPMVN